MRKTFLIFILGFISLIAKSQQKWETQFVIEFWRDDTSQVLIYDTLTIGLDKDGDAGFQLGLDEYVDSSDEFHAFFVDSIFYTEFQNKKLKKDIRKFPDKPGLTAFWSYIDRLPKTIFYDTNTLQLYISPYQTSISGQGPKGSSIGSWDYNSVSFLFFNKLPKQKFPSYNFYETPRKFFFCFRILIFDSLETGVFDQADETNVSIHMNENNLVISTPNPISNAQIEIMDITSKIVFKKSNLSLENTAEIQIDELTSGVYFTTIYTEHSYIYKKIFKP
ncbi:MAG: T9SS type A sorting domain-containing protein [Bacteroidia bacterium]|nr:T9SS type A sorting domain-containing protein [Bacteroidia bacterium]MCF8445404.1 T9SS type A sorting domain-containing protein [Bacteroidia bacterium]